MMPDVDLRPISLADARATLLALNLAIADDYAFSPETYASLVAMKALFAYRISLAEKQVAA